jgi:hypothetical protein
MAGNPWFKLEYNERELRNLLTDPHGPVARHILVKAGEIVTEGARRRAPVRTGRLRDEMSWRIGQDHKGLFVDVGTIFYARFLEKPARQIRRRRRFLRPALRDLRHRL